MRRDEITIGQRVRLDLGSEVREGHVVDIRDEGIDAYGKPTAWDVLVHTPDQVIPDRGRRRERTAWYPAGRLLPAT